MKLTKYNTTNDLYYVETITGHLFRMPEHVAKRRSKRMKAIKKYRYNWNQTMNRMTRNKL